MKSKLLPEPPPRYSRPTASSAVTMYETQKLKKSIQHKTLEGQRAAAKIEKEEWLANKQWIDATKSLSDDPNAAPTPVPRHATPTNAARARAKSTAALRSKREHDDSKVAPCLPMYECFNCKIP